MSLDKKEQITCHYCANEPDKIKYSFYCSFNCYLKENGLKFLPIGIIGLIIGLVIYLTYPGFEIPAIKAGRSPIPLGLFLSTTFFLFALGSLIGYILSIRSPKKYLAKN
jgi:hypothetical protein